jgi:hypothetical protein
MTAIAARRAGPGPVRRMAAALPAAGWGAMPGQPMPGRACRLHAAFARRFRRRPGAGTYGFIVRHLVLEEAGPAGSCLIPRYVAPLGTRANRGLSGSGRCGARGLGAGGRGRPQLTVVRGGGSVAEGTADLSMVDGHAAGSSIAGAAGSTAASPGGMIVPGQTAAQSREQLSAQQSIPS